MGVCAFHSTREKGAVVDAFGVVQPGLLSTIQDLGRFGYQKYGISVSGAMDKQALRIGNLLVGNREDAAAIEMTFRGPILRLLTDLCVAFTGGELNPIVNGIPVPTWQSLALKEGDVISVPGPPKVGLRAYLSVSGGIDVPLVMGSRSTHLLSNLGGLGRPLIKDDKLGVLCRTMVPNTVCLKADQIPVYSHEWILRVVFGPQDDYFTSAGKATFLSSVYQITPKANRMGYRLEGPRIEHSHGADILSDATPNGSIQVPGDGMPIILLADGQTTGGYAKIGGVISSDLNKLAQASPGDSVTFQRVELSRAHQIMAQAKKDMCMIKTQISRARGNEIKCV